MRFSNDLISLGVSVFLLGAYHYYLKWQVRRNPNYTIQAVNNIVRSAWVEGIMANSSKDVLAIQTLRNSTMAATFLASTAVLLILGTLTLSGQGAQFTNTWHGLNVAGISAPDVQGCTNAAEGRMPRAAELWVIKLLLLVIDFFVAFFSFSMSIRFFNHIGYMINIPATLKDYLTPQQVAAHLNSAGRFYSAGMRAYYFSVPLVFWLFGPHLMVLATVGLIVVLYRLDRA